MINVIKLTDDEMNLVKSLNNKVNKNLKSTPNYTDLYADDRFLTGYKGELAVYNYLKSTDANNELKTKWKVCTDGNSQPSEITIKSNIHVEVKTASKSFHKKLMMPASQQLDFDYLFGAKLLDDFNIEVMGFLPIQEFIDLHKTVFVKISTKVIDLQQLRKPETFIKYLNSVSAGRN